MWGATAHIVPARVLGFAQRLLLVDAPLTPSTPPFPFGVSGGFGCSGLSGCLGFGFRPYLGLLSWSAVYPHRRKRCTECCHRKRNDELDGPQVATNQGAQTSQGQADEQEDGDKGKGGGQGAVQRFSLPGGIDELMCVNT